jgi:hypothetical protein
MPLPSFAATEVSEPWKGHTETRPFELGLMAGGSIYGSEFNWSSLAAVAYLLKDKAFAPDLNNRILIELEIGPTFFSTVNSNQTGFQYSTHLRWDFNYNETWAFYALGGFSGFGLPKSLGGAFTFHPRFGVGVEYQTKTPLLLRGEVSAEFMGLGVAFNF